MDGRGMRDTRGLRASRRVLEATTGCFVVDKGSRMHRSRCGRATCRLDDQTPCLPPEDDEDVGENQTHKQVSSLEQSFLAGSGVKLRSSSGRKWECVIVVAVVHSGDPSRREPKEPVEIHCRRL